MKRDEKERKKTRANFQFIFRTFKSRFKRKPKTKKKKVEKKRGNIFSTFVCTKRNRQRMENKSKKIEKPTQKNIQND